MKESRMRLRCQWRIGYPAARQQDDSDPCPQRRARTEKITLIFIKIPVYLCANRFDDRLRSMYEGVEEKFLYEDLYLPRSLGVFGLMSCPGVRAGLSSGPETFDNLVRDFLEICENEVRMVISCLQPNELPFDPKYYHALYKSEKIQWEIVPITDCQPPCRSLDGLFTELFNTVDRRLSLGEKVAFHCYTGFGRTGTVVALYLIHKGLMPDDAISYVRRHYNSKAIKSAEQEAYLRSFAEV